PGGGGEPRLPAGDPPGAPAPLAARGPRSPRRLRARGTGPGPREPRGGAACRAGARAGGAVGDRHRGAHARPLVTLDRVVRARPRVGRPRRRRRHPRRRRHAHAPLRGAAVPRPAVRDAPSRTRRAGRGGPQRGDLRARARLRGAQVRERLLERLSLGLGLREDGEPLAVHRVARRRQPRRVALGAAGAPWLGARSTHTAKSATRSGRPSPSAGAAPRRATCSSCTSTRPAGSTTIYGSSSAVGSLAGSFP